MSDFDPDAYLADAPEPAAGSFDPDKYLADFNPDTYLAGHGADDGENSGRPTAEGPAATALRSGAHAVVPGGGALLGMGAGAAIGAPAGPVGSFVGTVVGGILGGMGAGVVQEKGLDAFDANDTEQRRVNAEANPKSAIGGEIAGSMLGFSPVATAETVLGKVAQRGAGAVMQGGLDAAQQYIQKGDVDPTEAAMAAAAGAVMPGTNRVGEKFVNAGARMVPGRPNRVANPAAEQWHDDVNDANPETNVSDSALAEQPPGPAQATTGNPQSAPTRSDRVYPKGDENAPPEGDMLTQGDMDPATAAALSPEQPTPTPQQRPLGMPPGNFQPPKPPGPSVGNAEAPIPGFDDHPSGVGQQPRAAPQVASDEGLSQVSQIQRDALNNVRKKASAQQLDQEPPAPTLDVNRPARPAKAQAAIDTSQAAKAAAFDTMAKGFTDMANRRSKKKLQPVVEAGFPEAGEPVAVGANDATPMPSAPPIKGRAAEPTEGQKEAGNYFKGRTHDFGKPIAIETHEGQVRSGKDANGQPWENVSPYHYGYFNKTKGPDATPGKPEGIDFARPDESNPAFGDKHFIIDQKNAETGKYDEPKVFNYFKDQAAAVDSYVKGFSDNKGMARLHDITEVSRPELVKYLAKHSTKAPRQPYGEPIEASAAKPVRERAVYKDLVAKKPELAEQLAAAPDAQIEKAIEGKRTRKYGTNTGASAGYAVEGLKNSEGQPVTANTKLKAQERAAKHKEVTNWFEESAPKKADETNGELLSRVKPGPGRGDLNGWAPTYKPREWLWAREAKALLAKPTPKAIEKFREAERMLRGEDADVENYRGGNRIEADIARSKRTGDDAVANAENRAAQGGVNTAEDAAIAAIDAKRGGKFDVPHEEAESMVEPTPVRSRADLKKLPHKTVDVGDSHLASIDTNAISKEAMAKADARKAEAAMLAGRKSAKSVGAEPETAGRKKTSIDVNDPDQIKRLIEASNQAAKKRSASDDEINRVEPNDDRGRLAQDMFDKFINDERGSLDLGAIKKSFDKLMRGVARLDPTRLVDAMPKTKHSSYHPLEPGERKLGYGTPERSDREAYSRSLDDKLHAAGKVDVNHFAALLNKAQKNWPAELDAAARERIFHARDADSAATSLPGKQPGKTNMESLPQRLQDLYNEHIKPLHDEDDKIVPIIRALDPERIGPDVQHHQSHILNGDEARFNILKRDDDPMAQGHYNGLSVSANAAKNRKYYALERNSDGRRTVVEETPKGFRTWDNYKQANIADPNWTFSDGGKYTVTPSAAKGGMPVDYTMRQATVKEKEANVLGKDKKPLKYFKDAGFSAMVSNAQLGSMGRHLQLLNEMQNAPNWKNWTTTHENDTRVKEQGWAQSTMPNFKGTFMHPDLKAVFDDFAGHPQDTYQALNQAVTKLIFVSPTAHWGNVAAHTIASRGLDNLSLPKNMKMLNDLPAVVKDVLSQGPLSRAMNRAGAGTVYGKVLTKDMPAQLGKAFQLDVQRNPSGWGKIADTLGIPMNDMVNSIYRATNHALWSGSDVMLSLRVRELQRKGIPMDQAIIDAERDIPNYRIPTTILGSRKTAQTFFNTSYFAFSRYHIGMLNAFASVFKDVFGKNATMGDRVDGFGKIMAVGMMAGVMYPLMDSFYKKLTGNKDAEANRRGPLTIPGHIAGALSGKEDVAAPLRSAATLSPLLSTGLETLANHDFRGKNIVEPGDVRAAAVHGNLGGAAKAVSQEGEHLARGLVAPYNMFASTFQRQPKDDRGAGGFAKSVAKTARDQALDIKDVSPAAAKYNALIEKHTMQDVRARDKKGGNGPFEGLMRRIFHP